MNLLLARKEMETLLIASRANSLAGLKALVLASMELERLEAETADKQYRTSASRVAHIVTTLRLFAVEHPTAAPQATRVLTRLAPERFTLTFYATEFAHTSSDTFEFTGDLKGARAQARKTLAARFPTGHCDLWSECTHGLPYEVIRVP